MDFFYHSFLKLEDKYKINENLLKKIFTFIKIINKFLN